jgi:hypothetical protein
VNILLQAIFSYASKKKGDQEMQEMGERPGLFLFPVISGERKISKNLLKDSSQQKQWTETLTRETGP